MKSQLEVVQSYQDKFLLTVYWALGTLATIAALLVGFGWFANFRVYERDKAALNQELRSLIETELQKQRQIVESAIAEARSAVPDLVRRASDSMSSSIHNEMASLKEELERKIDSLAARLQASSTSSSKRDANLELGIGELERTQWLDKGVVANALRKSRQILELSISMEISWRVSRALDFIQEDLAVMLKKGSPTPPDADDISQLMKLLEKVGPEHGIIVSSIKDRLSKMRQL